jgi:multiple sugar transport system permease protein
MTQPRPTKPTRERSVRDFNPSQTAAWIVLLLLLFISLFPLWVVLKTALTDQKSLYDHAADIFPTNPTLFNFGRVLGLTPQAEGTFRSSINMLSAFKNSVLFVGACVFGQILFSAMAAYAFARLRFPGRNFLFILILSAMMIPGIVLFIPNFILIKNLGWLNTFQGMIAPYVLMTPFAVFFLRQFFLSIPLELEEAARLDGASVLVIFFRIILPLSTGPLATLGILTTINLWNEFFWPYLVNTNTDLHPLTVALQIFRTQQPSGPPDWTGLMSGTFLSVIPVFLLLIFLGRQVVSSLQSTGSK